MFVLIVFIFHKISRIYIFNYLLILLKNKLYKLFVTMQQNIR